MKIGQIRGNNEGTYFQQIPGQKGKFETAISLGSGDLLFRDWAISLNGSNTFQYENNYYVKLKIKNQKEKIQNSDGTWSYINETQRTFTISLGNDTGTEQFLKSITLPIGEEARVANIELIFTPNITFSKIIIRMDRNAIDFGISYTENNVTYTGRKFILGENEENNSEDFKIYSITNKKPENVKSFNKIGVQGPPGLLMCINGQEIRVGPSGIYETRNGYKINFIGFIVKDERDNFILDYQYQEGS